MVRSILKLKDKKMIDIETKRAITDIGQRLALILPEFYGKVSFNYFDGKYVSFNVEQTVKKDHLYEGNKR